MPATQHPLSGHRVPGAQPDTRRLQLLDIVASEGLPSLEVAPPADWPPVPLATPLGLPLTEPAPAPEAVSPRAPPLVPLTRPPQPETAMRTNARAPYLVRIP